MKNNFYYFVLALLLAGFIIQGFQCGSPDFTGAKVQEQNKNYVEAAKLYEKEVQKNPSNHEAWFRLGRIRGEELDDYEGMAAAFREAEKLSPTYTNEIHAYRFKAWAQHINNGVTFYKRASADSLLYYDKAIEEYKKSVGIWPDTSLTYIFLTQAYQGKGDIENTVLSQKKVWELDHDVDAYKRVGRYIIQQGLDKKEQFRSANADGLRIQKGLKEIDKGSYKSDVTRMFGEPDSKIKDKKNSKREDWKYNQYALTLTFEGEKVVGKKIEKQIDLKIDSTKYYEAIVQFNNAVDVFEAIKKVNPNQSALRVGLTESEVISLLGEATSKVEAVYENTKVIQWTYDKQKAILYFFEGKLKGWVRNAVDNENLNLLLQAYYEANRIPEATSVFKLAVDNDPGSKMNHYILGLLYRMVDDYDGAIGEFNEAVKIDPNFSDAFYDIGATYYNWGVKAKKEAQEKGDESQSFKKKFEEALPWMIKVTDIKIKNAQETASKTGKDWHSELLPEDARVWNTLGTIYALLGQSEKAMKALDEADKISKTAK
jgi:tetratricopeptide (TPR) repeat protein